VTCVTEVAATGCVVIGVIHEKFSSPRGSGDSKLTIRSHSNLYFLMHSIEKVLYSKNKLL
jgi:hypothetical protein